MVYRPARLTHACLVPWGPLGLRIACYAPRCGPDQLRGKYQCEIHRNTGFPQWAGTPLTRSKQPSASTSVVLGAPNDETEASQNPEHSAYLSRKWRADQRTRTADLLITSDASLVAGMCRGLQNPHFQRVFFSMPCQVLHGIAFPVVSEWSQKTLGYELAVLPCTGRPTLGRSILFPSAIRSVLSWP